MSLLSRWRAWRNPRSTLARPGEYRADTDGWFRVRGVVWEPYPSTINIQAWGPEVDMVSGRSRTSADPQADMQVMDAALLLREAIVLRNVDITPAQLYRHIVGRDYRTADIAKVRAA